MALIRYKLAGGVQQGSVLLVKYSGGQFDINAAIQAGEPANQAFTVDDSLTALVAALDADPQVQRAGGGSSPSYPSLPVAVVASAVQPTNPVAGTLWIPLDGSGNPQTMDTWQVYL